MPLGTILGGIMSSGANNAAGQQAVGAGAQALANSYEVGNRDVARLSPWQASGAAAAQQINALLGLGDLRSQGDQYNTYGTYNNPTAQADAMAKFKTDPGYQFRLQQGVNALNNSAAARGSQLSGAQQKALSDYGQNTGSAEYGNYFNRLAGVSSLGQTAAQGANTAYNQALIPGIGDAFKGQLTQADYNVNSANAMASALIGVQNDLLTGDFAHLFSKGGTMPGGLGDTGATVPGNISGNAPGGYNYPSTPVGGGGGSGGGGFTGDGSGGLDTNSLMKYAPVAAMAFA